MRKHGLFLVAEARHAWILLVCEETALENPAGLLSISDERTLLHELVGELAFKVDLVDHEHAAEHRNLEAGLVRVPRLKHDSSFPQVALVSSHAMLPLVPEETAFEEVF
jgi:hypothetical protein